MWLTISKGLNFRTMVFALLMAFSWGLWWFCFPAVCDDRLTWLLFSSFGLLFAWSFVLYRRERPLAWACWLSLLAMIYLGLTLSRK